MPVRHVIDIQYQSSLGEVVRTEGLGFQMKRYQDPLILL